MMRRHIASFSLRQRITLGFSVLIFLYLGAMIFVRMVGIPGTDNKGNFAAYRATTLRDMELVSGLLIQRISSWFNACRMDIDGLTKTPYLRRALEGKGTLSPLEIVTELQAFLKSHPPVEAIAILDSNSASILASCGDFANALTAAEIDIAPEKFSRLVIPGYLETIDIHCPREKKPRLRIIRQIFSADTPNKLIAILVAENTVEGALHPLLWSVNTLLKNDWKCILASSFGGVVTQFREQDSAAASQVTLIPKIETFTPVRLALSGIDGPYDGPDPNGSPVLAFHRCFDVVSGVSLALVLAVDRDLALKPAWEDLSRLCFLWFFMFVAGICLCLFLAKRIAEPIRELAAVSRRIESGDLTARASENDLSETGQLASVFNGMVSRLQMWHQELEKQVLDRTRDMRASEEQLKVHLDHSPLAIIEWDASFIVTRWTGAAKKMFGWKPEETLGKPIMGLNHIFCEDVSMVEETMRKLTNGTSLYVVSSNRNVTKDGRVIYCEWYNSILNVDGKMESVLSQVLDVTARRQAEDDREELQQQMIQAAKMESVGRLAGGVAHDFNNMLGVILGQVDMAIDETKPGERLHAGLMQIRKAAKRSADLTRQLLAFARKQTIQPRVLDLNNTVASMMKMLHRLIGENIQLAWMPGTGVGSVKMDPGQIDQLLANMCVNSRDAIVDVGKIAIGTGRVTIDAAFCKTHEESIPGEYALLTVTDDGCGMDKATLSHLFEPFFTTKDVGKGTGLGMATVFGIVKQNHGFIEVSSEPGKGTIFKIYLPIHQGQETATNSGSADPLIHGSETVLLVEDEPELLALTQVMLKKLGYQVLPAETPAQALKLAEDHAGRIDLVMMDVILPEMNGRELASRLQSRFPHIALLFMSGYTADVIGPHGVLEEGVHFIEKPFSVADVAAKVRAALRN